jgi:hypothetical protein
MTNEFEELRSISYVFGVVDGSHVSIIAPSMLTSYYCWKGSYLVLLQGVVNAKCKFWNYDFGQASCYHDLTLFQKFDIAKKIMKGTFLPLKLIPHSKVRKKDCEEQKHIQLHTI